MYLYDVCLNNKYLLLKINVHIYHLVPADSKDAEEKLSKRLTINNVEENEPSKD